MGESIRAAFEPQTVMIALKDVLPLKVTPRTVRKSRKYLQILASIKDVGVIQPPAVARQSRSSGKFLLLDGHLRVEALKELEIGEVACLISTDDEAFTYNKRINRLAPIQEHRMILKAVERGVSEERIAAALDINVKSIRRKRQLLDGICPEAALLLRDRQCPYQTFGCLKKMKPLRQIEVAELMVAVNNFSVSYARSLLLATSRDQLKDTGKAKPAPGDASARMARIEKEIANLRQKFALMEDSYATDHLNLVIVRGHMEALCKNKQVARYLSRNHGDIFVQLQRVVNSTSIVEQIGE